MPEGARLFASRCKVVPFEVSLGVVAVWTGAMSLIQPPVASAAFNASLPAAMTVAFNLIYLLSGAFIVAGVGWGYRNVEASGVILLATALIVRLVAFTMAVGLNATTVAASFQSAVFAIACLVRLVSLLKNRILVFATDIPSIVKEQMRGVPE